MPGPMTDTLAVFLILLGAFLILSRERGASYATELYRKLGFEVSEAQYRKQFLFVGSILLLLGIGLLLELL